MSHTKTFIIFFAVSLIYIFFTVLSRSSFSDSFLNFASISLHTFTKRFSMISNSFFLY